ncbi:MAG: hypothetical protein ACI92S_005491, partial [Planctomycetaceae bacterium]
NCPKCAPRLVPGALEIPQHEVEFDIRPKHRTIWIVATAAEFR